MKSPIFGKEKLLYFPQKSGIVPIFKKSPSSYISYFCHHAPCLNSKKSPWTDASGLSVDASGLVPHINFGRGGGGDSLKIITKCIIWSTQY